MVFRHYDVIQHHTPTDFTRRYGENLAPGFIFCPYRQVKMAGIRRSMTSKRRKTDLCNRDSSLLRHFDVVYRPVPTDYDERLFFAIGKRLLRHFDVVYRPVPTDFALTTRTRRRSRYRKTKWLNKYHRGKSLKGGGKQKRDYTTSVPTFVNENYVYEIRDYVKKHTHTHKEKRNLHILSLSELSREYDFCHHVLCLSRSF